jgi:3,4-dihydroxy 2-butanone 4-phosphate synthase
MTVARGEFIIALDNPLRENEGDLIIAAQHATPSKVSFMIRYTSGYICAPLSASRCDALDLPQMVANNKDLHRTAYTVSVDTIREGVSTGISAHDRAATARALADPHAVSNDFRRPGHVLPLRAKDGGVRERQGHTEAAIELCRLAGKEHAALISELVTDGEEVEGLPELKGGSMMRRDDCLEFGRRWGIRVCTIDDLRRYVEEKEGRFEVRT